MHTTFYMHQKEKVIDLGVVYMGFPYLGTLDHTVLRNEISGMVRTTLFKLIFPSIFSVYKYPIVVI